MNRRGFLGAFGFAVALPMIGLNPIAGVEPVNVYPTAITFADLLQTTIRKHKAEFAAQISRNNDLLDRLSKMRAMA